MPEILGLDALILIANKYEDQCAFYEKVLGLPVATKGPDFVFYKVGEEVLGIFARSHHPEGTRRLGGADHGISHFEFRIREKDRTEFTRRLEEARALVADENFCDSDGNLFHFNFVP